MYAHETEQGRKAIRQRNLTAKFYGCVRGFDTVINPDPLTPIAISFHRNRRVQELAVVRNRSETRDEFGWSSILITSNKVDLLISQARSMGVLGRVIVGMADGPIFVWPVIDEYGAIFSYPRRVSSTKGDCMGSHFAERENTHLPLCDAEVFEPALLI